MRIVNSRRRRPRISSRSLPGWASLEREEESEETEEDEEEGDGEGLLFLLCFFFSRLSRLDERDLECFLLFFLDLCRFLSLSLEEEEEEQREEALEVEECFLFLCDFFLPLEREGERL